MRVLTGILELEGSYPSFPWILVVLVHSPTAQESGSSSQWRPQPSSSEHSVVRDADVWLIIGRVWDHSHLVSGSRAGRNILALYLLSIHISCFLLHVLSKLNLSFTGGDLRLSAAIFRIVVKTWIFKTGGPRAPRWLLCLLSQTTLALKVSISFFFCH